MDASNILSLPRVLPTVFLRREARSSFVPLMIQTTRNANQPVHVTSLTTAPSQRPPTDGSVPIKEVEWSKSRFSRAIVDRNRTLCPLEGARLSQLRREEAAMKIQRRKEKNDDRRKNMDVSRSLFAEMIRIKHEGYSLAEKKADEENKRQWLRQRFFSTVVMALSFTLEWRTKWRERIHKMEIFAHAVAGSPGEPNVGNEIKVENTQTSSPSDTPETAVSRLQRFVRDRLIYSIRESGLSNSLGGARSKSNKVRILGRWIRRAADRWRRRRQARARLLHEFLKDARLIQNIRALHRFRVKVLRCQVNAKGLVRVTPARVKLLALYYERCEEKMRTRLAGRLKQQVLNEAAKDLKLHRILHPCSDERETDKPRFDKSNTRAGDGATSDSARELIGTIAKLRLKSASEELQKRGTDHVVRDGLLKGLLSKVRKRHQANIVLNRERLRSQDMIRDIWGRQVEDFVEQKLYTVDDARDLIRVSSSIPRHCTTGGNVLPASSNGGVARNISHSEAGVESKHKVRSLVGLLGAVDNTCAGYRKVINENTTERSDGGILKARRIVRTEVPPLLLLRAVPEAVMCQQVLLGWEKSCAALSHMS